MDVFRAILDFVFGIEPANLKSSDEPDQSERKRGLASTALFNSWIVAFSIGLFAIGQMIDEHAHPVGRHLLEEAAVAFVIAYLIIIIIEYRSRKELEKFMEDFTKRSHENFFQVVLGVQFPVRMFELVKNYIM